MNLYSALITLLEELQHCTVRAQSEPALDADPGVKARLEVKEPGVRAFNVFPDLLVMIDAERKEPEQIPR